MSLKLTSRDGEKGGHSHLYGRFELLGACLDDLRMPESEGRPPEPMPALFAFCTACAPAFALPLAPPATLEAFVRKKYAAKLKRERDP